MRRAFAASADNRLAIDLHLKNLSSPTVKVNMSNLSEPNDSSGGCPSEGRSCEYQPAPQPQIGDRVFIKPAPGHRVQRAAYMENQFLPDEGMSVLWDDFHVGRLRDGSIVICEPPKGEIHGG